MQVLSFTRCNTLTDSLLSRLLGGAKSLQLEELTLAHCERLTEMCLIGLANAGDLATGPGVRCVAPPRLRCSSLCSLSAPTRA